MALNSETLLISFNEIDARRQAHEDARHSLRLEALDGLLTPEDEAQAAAWISPVVTMKEAIADTLQSIRAGAATAIQP